jgi:hypothetical protein
VLLLQRANGCARFALLLLPFIAVGAHATQPAGHAAPWPLAMLLLVLHAAFQMQLLHGSLHYAEALCSRRPHPVQHWPVCQVLDAATEYC